VLPVERWVIFYADESTFTSEQGPWAEAPPFGVQAAPDDGGAAITDYIVQYQVKS